MSMSAWTPTSRVSYFHTSAFLAPFSDKWRSVLHWRRGPSTGRKQHRIWFQSKKSTKKVPPNPLTCQKPSQHILAQSSVKHRDLKGRWWFIGQIHLHTNCNEQSGQLWEGVLGLQLLESLTFWKDLLHFLELKIGQICQKQHNKWKNMKAPVAPVKSRKRKQETTKNILYLNHTEDTT